jgi:protein tyrosine phosphatase (PTP) superfamily phosphohydrolase (DUF442 family)
VRFFSSAAVCAVLTCLTGCSGQNEPDAVPDQQPATVSQTPASSQVQVVSQTRTDGDWTPERIDDDRLPNAYRLHERVISGGQPDEAGMQALQELGVKTIISVDGARPDVALAEQYGMRYVHLPHGYDGIPEERARELAKAVRDLEGPIYIHCHHGKHRSPAAAATACIEAGLIPPAYGLPYLHAAGTSENYRGLYESVERAHPLDRALLDALNAEFPSAVDVPPLAEAMVAVEHTHDDLKLIAENGWKPVPEHPDLEPAHEALLLREHYRELLRTEEVQQKPEQFQQWLRESEQAAQTLEDALRAFDADAAATEPPAEVTESFAAVSEHCKMCHQRYRDVPLSEKGETAQVSRD